MSDGTYLAVSLFSCIFDKMTLPVTETFTFPVRVYYEDTDAGGIVYHVNYLKFMERARTEYLRTIDYDHQALLREQQVLVVVDAAIRYRQPAKLDDALKVTAVIQSLGRARMTFTQQVFRDDILLCEGQFVIGCLNSETMKPVAITESLRNKLSPVTI